MALDLRASTRARVSQSPHRQELIEFVAWLEAQHYSDFAADLHLRRLAFVLPRLARDSHAEGYSADQLEAAFGAEHAPRSRFDGFAGTRRAYRRFLAASGRLRVRPPENRFGELRQGYARYNIELRGLSVSSCYQHAHTVADFLARGLRPRQPLSSLSRAEVERYILLRSRELSRHSLQHAVGHLRAFLRYAHEVGYLRSRLDGLDTPRTYLGELPPRAVPWSMVQKLLASIDRESKAGWRDYCILHLIAHYGLRPSEVAGLRLDSIDWDTEVLHVYQPKTSTELLLPLAQPTLRILRSYLRHDRMRHGDAHHELFLRARCPYGPLQRYAIGDLLEKRAREAGLPVFDHNAYRLRHTFAMRLLTRGVGVKAIGDVLGHRTLASTSTYLRLDLAMLRGVALPVPAASASTGGRHA